MTTDKSIRRSTLIVATTSSFISPFMISSINVALPAIEHTFAVDAVLLSWVSTAYLLAAGVFLIPMGRLADIYGRKKMLGAGFILLSLSSLSAALAPNIGVLIGLRVLQGIGGGMIYSTGLAILTSVYPPRERGRVLGIVVAAVYIGLSSGPFVGGLVTHQLGWAQLFLLNGLICVVPIFLIATRLKGEWADAAGESYDLLGSGTYAVALVAMIYGFTRLQTPMGVIMGAGGGLGLWMFCRRQLRMEYPLFAMHLFVGNRTFALSNLAALINYGATFGITFLLSLYLQYIQSMDAQSAGLVLVSQPVVMALFSPLAGRLSDRIEPRKIASVGMALTAMGLLALSLVDESTSTLSVLGWLAFLGLGFALFSSPNMNAIMGSVDKRYLGIASGSAGTMRVLGQVLSMGIATFILSIYMHQQEIAPPNYPALLRSIRMSFLVFAIVCAIGIVASLARGDLHDSGKPSAQKGGDER